MSTIAVNEIRKGVVILHKDDPTLILSHDFHKMGRGGAINKTKVKNLRSGAIFTITFSGNERAEVVDVINKNIQYLYSDAENAFFMDPNSYEQMQISLENIDGGNDYLLEGKLYQGVFFEGEVLSLVIPKKLSFKVSKASAAVKGDSANNPSKEVELETGLSVSVPLFIKEGDVISINTEDNSYTGKDNN